MSRVATDEFERSSVTLTAGRQVRFLSDEGITHLKAAHSIICSFHCSWMNERFLPRRRGIQMYHSSLHDGRKANCWLNQIHEIVKARLIQPGKEQSRILPFSSSLIASRQLLIAF
jgi:hypothetical protein